MNETAERYLGKVANDQGFNQIRVIPCQIVWFFFLKQKWTLDLEPVAEWQAHEYQVYALVSDEQRQRLFSSSSGGEIKEWDANSGEMLNMTIMKVGLALRRRRRMAFSYANDIRSRFPEKKDILLSLKILLDPNHLRLTECLRFSLNNYAMW